MGRIMNDDTTTPESTDAIGPGVTTTGSTVPTLSEWIGQTLGFQLPALPAMPQTLKNLDKVGAALLDWPLAGLEGTAASRRSQDALEVAVTDAMRRALEGTGDKQITGQVRGMVRDYLGKNQSRRRVLELAVREIASDAGRTDATAETSDDFMAFFKGKVDNLGTDEARMLFAKVLAGEVKRPGSFSKPAMSILAEMDSDVGQLFELLCKMSVTIPAAPSGLWQPRVLTLGMGNAGANALREFGLGFGQLNILNEAGLIISDYNSHIGMGGPFELAGQMHHLLAKPTADMAAAKTAVEGQLQRVDGVAFTKAGSELRRIVSMTPHEPYVARLRAEFDKIGAIMT